MRLAISNRSCWRSLLPTGCVLLLALCGCRGPEPGRPGGSLDLLPLAHSAEGGARRGTHPIRFHAGEGSRLLGGGWAVGLDAEGGAATAVSNGRQASLHFPLSPANSGNAVIRLRLRDPRAAGDAAAGVIVTFNGRKVKRIVPGEAWSDHRLVLPADRFQQGVNELVLVGEPGRTAIRWLDLALPGPQVHATAGDITRRALVSPAPLVIDLADPLPAGARLGFSLAMDPRPAPPAAAKTSYRLEGCRPDGEWELLLEKGSREPCDEYSVWRHGGWSDHVVSLARLAGGLARLRLSGGGSLGVWGSLTLSWPGTGTAPEAVEAAGPNLILILADTLRADRLGAAGSAVRLTPSLDALAGESVLFRDTMAQAPSTVPSVSSFFTGRYFSRLARWVDRHCLPPALPLLAQTLAAEGCRTLAVVSNPLLLPETGFARGFDEYHHLPGVIRQFHERGNLTVYQPAEAVNARFLQCLPSLAKSRFFAFLHYMDPHDPYPVENEGDSAPHFSGGRLDGLPWEGWLGPATKEILDHGESSITAGDRGMVPRAYDNGVRRFDRQLGLLLAELRRRGLLSNTVVAVVADHGEEFFEHGLLGHGHTIYDELLRVPALVRFPRQSGFPRPSVVTRRVELLDVAATLLDVMGAGPPQGHAGQSLLPLLNGEAGAEPGSARFFETRDRPWVGPPLNGNLVGVESDGWKLIRDRANLEERLYHLRSDPGETSDLIALHPEKAAEMRRRLERWIDGHQPLEPGAGGGRRSSGEVAEREVEALKALGYMQ